MCVSRRCPCVVALVALLAFGSRTPAEKPEAELARLREVNRHQRFTTQLLRAQVLLPSDPAEALALLHDGKACPAELRDFSWGFLARQARRGGRTFKAHENSVEVVAFAPDGRTLVTAANKDEVKIWDSTTQKLLNHLQDVTFPLAFSANGKYLATTRREAGEVWSVVVWNVESGTERDTTKSTPGVPVAVHVSDDAKQVRTASRLYNAPVRSIKGVEGKIWDLPADKVTASWLGEGDGFPHPGLFSADGKRFAIAAYTWAVRVREADTGKELLNLKEGHTTGVTHLALSRDAKVLAAESGDGGYGRPQVKVWDLTTGKSLGVYRDQEGSPSVVALDREGKLLAALAAPGAVVWEVPSGRTRVRLPGGPGTGRSLDMTSDGALIATGGADGLVALWPLSADPGRVNLEGHEDAVGAVAFSPDGKLLASGSGRWVGRFPSENVSGDFIVWDVATGKLLKRVVGHTKSLRTMAFSPDGRLLATGGFDAAIILWDTTTRKDAHTIRAGTSGIVALHFAPDGKTLLSASYDGAIRRWDSATGKELGLVAEVGEGLSGMSLSGDGRLLAIATRPVPDLSAGGLRLLETATGKVRQAFAGHTREVMGVVLSRDGKTAAAGGRGYLKVFDAETEAERFAIDVPATADLRDLLFTPGGQELVATVGRSVRVYDVLTGQERLRLPVEATSLALSKDGGYFAVGQEKNVGLWPAGRED